MPDFDFQFTAGVTVSAWTDNRANPRAGHPSLGYKGTVGNEIVASMNGAVADAEGGALFSSDMGEWPEGTVCPSIYSVTGYSSIQIFIPSYAGHYLWILRHVGGGAYAVHIEAL